MADVRITYQQDTDVAYLYLDNGRPRVVNESRICEQLGDPIETVIDMDEAGRVIGIELYFASKRLPERLLLEAEIDPPSS